MAAIDSRQHSPCNNIILATSFICVLKLTQLHEADFFHSFHLHLPQSFSGQNFWLHPQYMGFGLFVLHFTFHLICTLFITWSIIKKKKRWLAIELDNKCHSALQNDDIHQNKRNTVLTWSINFKPTSTALGLISHFTFSFGGLDLPNLPWTKFIPGPIPI